jgi:hypothetical protein
MITSNTLSHKRFRIAATLPDLGQKLDVTREFGHLDLPRLNLAGHQLQIVDDRKQVEKYVCIAG